LSWAAEVCRTEYLPSREEQRQNRSDDEKWAIRFKNGQVSNPRATKSQRNQDQRPKANMLRPIWLLILRQKTPLSHLCQLILCNRRSGIPVFYDGFSRG